MPLENHMPELDGRTADEIFEAARLRIPLYTPEWETWTDYNESDPGITLLQLFAWLTEQMLFQMNQMPERNYLKFLKLLNMEQRPAQPATAHVTFVPSGKTLARPVPEHTQVAAQSSEGGTQIIYESQNALDVISVPLKHVVVYDGLSFVSVSLLNDTGMGSYRPFGAGQPGSALYLGFVPTEELVNATNGGLFPQRLTFRVFLPAASQRGSTRNANDFLPSRMAAITRSPVDLVWEYQPENSESWQPLAHQDESLAFTREGYVNVDGPGRSRTWVLQGSGVDEACIWLRCRIVERSYPANAVPVISFIRPNVVPVQQCVTVSEEFVGVCTGERGERFTLRRRPVLPESLVLELRPVAGTTETDWVRQDDFLASTRENRHFVLQPTTGTLTFGDGLRGRIPPAGTEIIAKTYRYGGGAAGNVGAGAIRTPLATLNGVKEVKNERAAVGGRDEQDIEDLKRSAPYILRSRNRAVTVEDYSELAQAAGGVQRAQAFPLMHPDYPEIDVPGAITVVIVPEFDEHPPRPSDDLIASVCNYLNQFRVVTTELYVKPPKYIPVKVKTTLAVDPMASTGLVHEAVQKAINDYLNPRIWPFGGDLYPTRLYGEILKIAQVRAVEFMEVYVENQLVEITQRQRLRRDELVYGGDHTIDIVPYEDR